MQQFAVDRTPRLVILSASGNTGNGTALHYKGNGKNAPSQLDLHLKTLRDHFFWLKRRDLRRRNARLRWARDRILALEAGASDGGESVAVDRILGDQLDSDSTKPETGN